MISKDLDEILSLERDQSEGSRETDGKYQKTTKSWNLLRQARISTHQFVKHSHKNREQEWQPQHEKNGVQCSHDGWVLWCFGCVKTCGASTRMCEKHRFIQICQYLFFFLSRTVSRGHFRLFFKDLASTFLFLSTSTSSKKQFWWKFRKVCIVYVLLQMLLVAQ